MSLTNQQQQLLLNLAKESIKYGLVYGESLPVDTKNYSVKLREIRGVFVTLEIDKQLRGCIGTLEALNPIVVDVAKNAFLAAFQDSRFPPLSEKEYLNLSIHISILSPCEPIIFESEADLIRQLQPHEDGLILQEGLQRGTFLPSVWESLPEAQQFLQHLKLKTGLPKNYWSDTLQVHRYRCETVG